MLNTFMAPTSPLPLPEGFSDADTFVESLLDFTTSSDLFQKLCGGVHILDFLTQEPDLHSTVLPTSWRQWFLTQEMADILDLLMREDLHQVGPSYANDDPGKREHRRCHANSTKPSSWRGGPSPPDSLLEYIRDIRGHSLNREFHSFTKEDLLSPNAKQMALARHVTVGMKPKKVHEVENFARYVDDLTSDIAKNSGAEITHIVDFGSGQNYLGRALASKPYSKHVIAIESKKLNIDGARGMDISAKLTKKEKIMRNKREFRSLQTGQNASSIDINTALPTTKASWMCCRQVETMENKHSRSRAPVYTSIEGKGSVQYIEHEIQNGDLTPVIDQITAGQSASPSLLPANDHNEYFAVPIKDGKLEDLRNTLKVQRSSSLSSSQTSIRGPLHGEIVGMYDEPSPKLMVISLHSCGNLLHHGIRSLTLNPSVAAVALVGCCYNLVTERLGPPTYKLPTLRPPNARLDRTSSACDPHGFPVSERLATYHHKQGEGVRLNITARMMAVQAPQNWTAAESEAFFTRHFFRALFQRILLDRGVVRKPSAADDTVGGSPREWSGEDQPIIIGSLRKNCYASFTTYVRGAVAKLAEDPKRGQVIAEKVDCLTDDEIEDYEKTYYRKKKELSIVWSLMAFSAGVVESVIVVDRWLFLKEQKEVKNCWVEAVFDYEQSPRNMLVVGIKR